MQFGAKNLNVNNMTFGFIYARNLTHTMLKGDFKKSVVSFVA